MGVYWPKMNKACPVTTCHIGKRRIERYEQVIWIGPRGLLEGKLSLAAEGESLVPKRRIVPDLSGLNRPNVTEETMES